MKLKKIFFFIIIILLIYYLSTTIIKTNIEYVEKFANQFVDDPEPYNSKCKKNFEVEPNYYKYSTNDLRNVYRISNYNKCQDLYLKDLAKIFDNQKQILDSEQNNKSNNICKIKTITSNKKYSSSIDSLKKKLLKYVPKKIPNNCDCTIPDIITYFDKDNNILLKFQKINSVESEININENNMTNNDMELSNEIFQNALLNLTSNNKQYFKNFNDITKNIDNNSYSLYYNIEKNLLKQINSIEELKSNTEDFIVIKRYINHFLIDKNNKNNCEIDLDLLIYRKYKNNGKHINFVVKQYDNNLYITCIRIIGIVNSDSIILYNSDLGYINKKNNKDFFLSLGNYNDKTIYSFSEMNEEEISSYIKNHEKDLQQRLQ